MRIEAVRHAAVLVFGRKGYAATTLREVLAVSGGSKSTLRKYFGGKQGLFAAVIGEATDRFVAEAHFSDQRGAPVEVLEALGRRVLAFYVRHDALQAYRGVVSGGFRDPRVARIFHQRGHAVVREALAVRIGEWTRAGLIASDDATADADAFLHLLRAGCHEEILIGLRARTSARELGQVARHATRIFLRGVSV